MIGIDISDRSIKIAELSGKRQSRLHTICWSPLPPNLIRRGVVQDVESTIAALRETFTKCSPVGLSTDAAVASIPETQSFVRVLDLPQMSSREMEEAVQWAIRQHIPFDLERVYIDWQSLPVPAGAPARQQVLVGAVQRDVVDPLLQVLDGAGVRVVALELEAQAIVRCLLPKQAVDVHGILLVDLGATATNVMYFDEGVLKFTTSVQSGGDDLTQQLAHDLKLEPQIAAEKKAAVGVDGGSTTESTVSVALREATTTLLQRVGKVVREMAAQLPADNTVRAILLSGGSANLPGIRNLFAEVFPGIPIQLGNPWTNIAAPEKESQMPLSPADATHFVTALGLALREPEDI